LASQVEEFLWRELEREVFRKSEGIAPHGPDQRAGLHTVECCQVRIKHHPVASNQHYRLLDSPHRHKLAV